MVVVFQGAVYTGLALCSLKESNSHLFSDLVDFCSEILFVMGSGCCIWMGRGRGILRWNVSWMRTEEPVVGVQEITGE